MKRIYHIATLFLMAMACMMTSCDKENPFAPDGNSDATGTVNFRKMLLEVRNEENIVRSSSVDINSFIVKVTNSRTQVVEWEGTYESMPEVMTLQVGTYEVNVNSGYNPEADWETPYFEGKQEFTITEGTITNVDPVVCTLANVKVTVIFDDSLRAVMGDDCTVTVNAGSSSLVFNPSETRSGYFKYEEKEGSKPTLVATFNGTVDNNLENNFRTYTEVKPGNHYKITYALKGVTPNVPDQEGFINPGLFVDASVTVVNMTIDVNVDDDILDDDLRPGESDPGQDPTDPDQPTDPVDPKGELPELTTNPAISFDKDNVVVDGLEAVVYAHSSHKDGITEFYVDIDSNTLTPDVLEADGIDLSTHLDLVNPGKYAEKLEAMGFPINVKGMTDPSPMKLTDFLPLLTALGPGTHKFHLVISDGNGTTKKTLTFITQ